MPIGDGGWLAVASRGRALAARLARPAAQAAVPLLAATERLDELARDQERAVRSALLDEALDGLSSDERALAARAASFGLDFARARAGGRGLRRRRGRRIERSTCDAAAGIAAPRRRPARPLRWRSSRARCPPLGERARRDRPARSSDIARRPALLPRRQLAVERVQQGTLAYEDFDLATLLLSEVAPEHIRPRVDELLAPLRANPPLLEALVEYFARDMDVNATAEAMHVHPNTLRYRLSRVEKLLGRSLRQPGDDRRAEPRAAG